MELRELRIDNMVKMNDSIIVMDARIFHAIIHNFPGYDPNPIPITIKWLIGLGFKWLDNLTFDNINECNCRIQFSGGSFWWQSNDSFNEVELKYVHELQNLFFAHYKKELTLC